MSRSRSSTFRTPNRLRFFGRDLDGRDGRAGAAVHMEAQHLRVVHLVDVVPGQHDQLRGFSRRMEYRF